jgi:hypothetical protein
MQPVYLRRAHFGVDETAPDDHREQRVHRAADLRGVVERIS